MNILIVEDQQRLAAALKAICEEAGLTVDCAFDGQEGLDYALLGHYDAIVLDVMLPKKDGFAVIAELRAAGNNTPVIMLTARTATRDKIDGLNAGADDYLTKPFNPAELLARLRALTRRKGAVVLDTMQLGNTVLSLEAAELFVAPDAQGGAQPGTPHAAQAGAQPGTQAGAQPGADGGGTPNSLNSPGTPSIPSESVHLSQREFEVLKLFFGAAGKTFSKLDILERVWGLDSDADENSVEVYISFLRKKLAHIGSNVSILTVRSLGYRVEVANG